MIKKTAFSMGCFWSPQSIFDKVDGVIKTTVGYMGGESENPTYKQVCSGKTGHAETVYIEYDDEEIQYDDLLNLFWQNHNPTTKNRQGADIGSQYKSMIFYFDDEQKQTAEKSLEEHQKTLRKKIVTEIVKALEFYPAEEYHQKYYEKTGKRSCKI